MDLRLNWHSLIGFRAKTSDAIGTVFFSKIISVWIKYLPPFGSRLGASTRLQSTLRGQAGTALCKDKFY